MRERFFNGYFDANQGTFANLFFASQCSRTLNPH